MKHDDDVIIGAGCDHRVQGERGLRDGTGACRGAPHIMF